MLIENVSRRSFLTAAGGLAIGFFLPLARGGAAAEAPAGAAPVPEINAWVVIRPDDTVVIRIARSEMGQGTLTGLAQLIAEELECDWSKVTTEYPTPGQSLARNRIWGDYLTAGSRGIRTSHEYVRKAGAAARQMLVEAAAKEWSVPSSEISAAKSVLRHEASDRSARYGEFDRWWQVNTALNALPIVWDEGPNKSASTAAFAEVLKEGLTSTSEIFVGNTNGDSQAALSFEALYGYPHQNHTTLEPMNATALWAPKKWRSLPGHSTSTATLRRSTSA